MTKFSDYPELARRFDAAMVARDEGDLPTAMAMLRDLLDSSPPEADGVIAGTCSQLGYITGMLLDDHAAAVDYFSRAVQLRPRNELASLGLFHALFDSGSLDDAMAEALRFVSLRDCDEYRNLFAEGYEVDFSGRGRQLVVAARAELAKRRQERAARDSPQGD